jgi:N-acetyl-gamma-glutamyl-phosphate reductase
MKSVGIIGGSGYTGGELIRILSGHPGVRLAAVSSRRFESQPLSAAFPWLEGLSGLQFVSQEEILADQGIELIFSALGHAESVPAVAGALESGRKVVDLSADFRFKDAATYTAWYGTNHGRPDLLSRAVYGLPEAFREMIRNTDLCANPGCYAAAVILALLPLASGSNLGPGLITVDAKSGVSGAGRLPKDVTVFPECHEGLRAYSPAGHRHQPEMEAVLQEAAAAEVRITFVPHLVPANRGILATIYMDRPAASAQIREIYQDFYREEPFVVLNEEGSLPGIQDVKGSNCCRIGLAEDRGRERLIIFSALDNLVKGASGQAVQNMNIMLGLPEESGLASLSVSP